jgi:hypothetical protein
MLCAVLQVLSQLDLADPTVQHTLLALLPLREGGDGGDLGGDENAPTHNVSSPLSVQGSMGSLPSGFGGAAGAGSAARLWPLGQVGGWPGWVVGLGRCLLWLGSSDSSDYFS